MLRPGNQYHVGCVVTDLDQSVAEVAASIGTRFTAVQARDLDCRTPEGRATYPIRFAYSVDPLHVELVERIEGSLWDTPTAVHHIGYWSDDLVGDCAALLELGHRCVYSGATDEHDGIVRGAYFRMRSGLLVELVDVAMRPAFEQLIGRSGSTEQCSFNC